MSDGIGAFIWGLKFGLLTHWCKHLAFGFVQADIQVWCRATGCMCLLSICIIVGNSKAVPDI